MRNVRLQVGKVWLGFLLVACTVLPATVHAQVRSEHPRIYMTSTRRDQLVAVRGTHPGMNALLRYMRGRVSRPAGADTELRGVNPQMLMLPAAFTAAIYRDAEPTLLAEVRRYLSVLAAIPPNAALENDLRNRLYAMAIGYDWMYADLTAMERTALRDAMVAHVTALATLPGRIDSPNFVEGTSRWGCVTTLAASIAIHGEDTRLDARLTDQLAFFRDGFNPALQRMGEGGAHPMGWLYGPAYSGIEPYWMWRTASLDGEAWSSDFLRDAAYPHLYGMTFGSGTTTAHEVPIFGDAFNSTLTPGAYFQAAYAARIEGNAHAESFYRSLESDNYVSVENSVFGILMENTAPSPMPIESLPLSRYFPGTGLFTIRDQWTPAQDAALTVFKASPYYTKGHHHRDEGTLYVDYRGRLLMHGGDYDGSGTSLHDTAFYARSVAHNTMIVEWPTEPASGLPSGAPSTVFPNDGGQVVYSGIPRTRTDLDTTYRRRGMTGHSDAGTCVWARADLGDTYHSGKVTTYTRDILEVRRPGGAAHPAIYVYDSAVLPVARRAAVLWHFPQTASMTSTRIESSNPGGGRIRLDVLAPASPTFTSHAVGDARWDTLSGRYLPSREPRYGTPYWGRVEVAAPALTTTPSWSTLIRIGDASLASDTTAPIAITGADYRGARLGNTLFVIASNDTTRITLPAGASLVDGCIAGLAPSRTVEVVVGTGAVARWVANADGVATFAPPAEIDAGTVVDAGVSIDAAIAIDGAIDDASASDAAMAAADANVASPDATQASDAATPSADAARNAPDAGNSTLIGGCGCHAHASNPPWMLGIALGALITRRTRRRC